MAFSEQNPLDYRSGGDRVKTWGAKYKQEIPHIYDILNSLLKHQPYGDVALQEEDGAMKIFTLSYEDGNGVVHTERHLAIGIDSGDGFQWVDIGQVTERFGAPLTSEALTNDDVATQEYEAYKLVKTDGNGILPVDISGNAAKVAGKIIAVNNLSDGQVMVWRAYDQRWHNENKSAVGEGKALEITNGSTALVVYSGDEDKSVDVGKWNNVTLSKTVENIADIRYVPVLESSSAETGKLQKATPEPDGKTIAMRDTEGCLIATTPATADDSQKVATTANVKAKITAHNNDSGAHTAAFAVKNKELMENTLGYRKADTAYTAGQIAYHASLPTGYHLECITPGTTGSGDLTISSPDVYDTLTDGTVTWIVCKYQLDFPRYGAFNQKETFTSSGTFTAPVSGTYRITLKGAGGGGGGGSANSNKTTTGGAGAGEGAIIETYEFLTVGTSYSYVVGAGGTGTGTLYAVGGDGGNTTITVNSNAYVAGGGKGSNIDPGAGGIGTINNVAVSAGAAGSRSLSVYSSNASDTSLMVRGGTGGGAGGGAAGNAGVFGGGGGGSSYNGSAGGAGGNGYITFEYCNV